MHVADDKTMDPEVTYTYIETRSKMKMNGGGINLVGYAASCLVDIMICNE